MPDKPIVFKIDAPRIPARTFTEGIEAFLSLIREVSDDIYAGKNYVKWYISVRKGSAIIQAHPSPSGHIDAHRLGLVIGNGIESIEAGKAARPPHFTNDALWNLRKIGTLCNPKERISFTIESDGTRYDITTQSTATVDKLVREYGEAVGSIEGILITLTLKGGFQVFVKDDSTKRDVRCHLDVEQTTMEEQMKSSFGKRVSVWGTIHYGRDGRPASIDVKSMRALKEPGDLPPISTFEGILKDL